FDDFGAVPADLEEAVAVNHNSEAIKTEATAQITRKSIDLKLILAILYTLVGVISLGLLAYNTARIYRLRSKSRLTYEEDYTLAEHEDIKTPFSFIRTIFMGFNYEPQERRQILIHEASHVRHRHSYERLFMSVLRSIFWFNPFFWMAEKDLEEVQEWEADKDVLDEGWNLKTYRTTIFKQLFGYNPDITCGLNHSLTKQRFIMMTQSHRGKGAWLRLAATLPVIAATFFAFGCGTKQAEMTEVSTNLTDGTEATYIDMCPPCDATVSNSFSAGRAGRSHTGIDYVLNEGDPVYAAADGKISTITRDNSNGLMVILKHADGYETRYAHLSKVNICTELSIESSDTKVNRTFQIITDADHSDQTITGKVKKGQLIGYAGSTGRATGPHLHFEVRQNGKSVDPVPLFKSDKLIKAPLQIYVIKDGDASAIICNGKRIDVSEIGQIVAEYFAGEEMYNANVSISADEGVSMGIITDIKEQLRNARALKVRYETDDSAIEKRLPPAPKTEMYPATVDVLVGTNRRNIIVMRVNPNGEMFLGSTYVKGSLHNDDLYAKELARLKELISNPEESAECPEIEMIDIQMPDGSTRQFRVSKGMITFQNDRATSYEDYTKAMKLITTAYKELREEVSAEVFGKPLVELSDAEMQVIYQAVPMNVSEVQPKDAPARP
ncbi:MAG: M23/M56 family metallopeptidase, partial [Bacteroidales bacterium]|nr:M23/M56 family metallopeptidase [Bacteroidales bacterium]